MQELQEKQNNIQDKNIIEDNQLKIKSYQTEINRIKSLFPENFFEENF